MSKQKVRKEGIRVPAVKRRLSEWETGSWPGAPSHKLKYYYCKSGIETLKSIANKLSGKHTGNSKYPIYANDLTWQKITLLNFGTEDPPEVNWYLEHFNGCGLRITTDRFNYGFDPKDDRPWLWIPTAQNCIDSVTGKRIPCIVKKVTTLKVIVWEKKDNQPPKRLSGAYVKLSIYLKEKQKTNEQGETVFSPVEPKDYDVIAWKDEGGLVYRTKDETVSIKKGESKELNIFLKPEIPYTVFVKILDCKGKGVPKASVTLGAWSQNHDHQIPIPGIKYETIETDSKGEDIGQSIFRRVSNGKYKILAKKIYKYKIYNRDDKEYDTQMAGVKDIIINNPPGGYFRSEISICPKDFRFRLIIKKGEFFEKSLPSKVFGVTLALLSCRIDISIKNIDTGEVSDYSSDYAPLIKYGVATPGVLPGDHVTFKGAGWSNEFKLPRFDGGRLINQTSFSGKIGLQLVDYTKLGTCLNIEFYNMPGKIKITGLILVNVEGLPDLPSIKVTSTGTGGAKLTRN
jgi:hypothetical protein